LGLPHSEKKDSDCEKYHEYTGNPELDIR
jgi:hypothetical protein